MTDLIDPSQFPIPETYATSLEWMAGKLKTDGTDLTDSVGDITGAWSGLEGVYSAPEAEDLYGALSPLTGDASDVSSDLSSAADALIDFAEAVAEIKRRWTALRSDSYAFLQSIDYGNQEGWDEGGGFLWWKEESDKVTEHNALLDRAAGLVHEFEEAERTCANAITALVGGTRFVAQNTEGTREAGGGEFVYGFDEPLEGVAMEWGAPQATDHAWYNDVGDAVGDFTMGALEDLGGMVGLHGEQGWLWSGGSWGDNLWDYYGGALEGTAALAGFGRDENGNWGHDWGRAGEAWRDTAHAVVPWEEWGERPWYVIGTAALNVGAVVGGVALSATGVGAVVGAPLLAWRGSRILNAAGGGDRTPDIDTPDFPGGIDPTLLARVPRFGDGPLAQVDLGDLDGLDLDADGFGRMTEALSRLDGAQNTPDPHTPGGGPGAAAPRTPDTDPGPEADGRPAGNGGNGGERRDPTAEELDAAQDVLDGLDPDSRRDVEAGLDAEEDAWVASQVPDDVSTVNDTPVSRYETDGPEGDREPALLGPRADTGDAEAVPEVPADGPLDLSGSDGDRYDQPDTEDRDGVEAADRGPEVVDSVDNDVRPEADAPSRDSPAGTVSTGDGPGQGGGTDSGDGAPGGSGRPGGAAGGDGPTGDTGGADTGAPEPLDPQRRDAYTRQVRTQEVVDRLGLEDGNVSWREFSTRFTELVNERPDLFNEFYDRGGSRRSTEIKVGDHTIPVLTRADDASPWVPRDSLATPDRPNYLTAGERITVHADPDDPRVGHLNDLAEERRQAIDADQAAEKTLRDQREQYGQGSPEAIRAENEHSPKHHRMTTASEDFGEAIAEHAVREQFDGHHTMRLSDGEEVDLPALSEDGPVVHSTRPANGNHQFDQIWRTDDGGIVVVEAKSSTDTGLGERTVTGADGEPKRVQQGTREYMMDILEKMRERGRDDLNATDNELSLAREIQTALDEGKLHYVEVKGVPDGNRFGGYTFGAFDVSK
ncbi:hypothetical protein [Nocardiopsis sp. LOL_012]|uniref:hypothetical protein n=1 Tax=Nocardiopsis sp. LOL_012 TaxID=3345409 RepID=UPI003A8B0102